MSETKPDTASVMPAEPSKKAPEDEHWLRRPATIRWLWTIGICLLIIVTLMDFIVHKHPHFGLDGLFGFYSLFGFGACAVMVIFAKALGVFLKRKDTYYDDAA